MKKSVKKHLFIILIFIVILSILIPFSLGTMKIYNYVLELEKESSDVVSDAQEDLLNIVVSQTQLRAQEFYRVFYEYQRIHEPNWFQMEKGGYVFHSTNSSDLFIYYPDEMKIIQTYNNRYNIFSFNREELLAEGVYPEWNKEELNKFLNVAVRETRLFGPEGDPIIIDQMTKEILIDDSFNCADTPNVMGLDGRRYMTLDWKHPNNMNPEASKWVIENILPWNREQMWIYFFTAPYITIGDLENDNVFNFEKYPLELSSDVGREVGWTTVIDIRNKEGFSLSLRIMFGAQEYEFTSYFKNTYNSYSIFIDTLNKTRTLIIVVPLAGLLIIIICLIIIYFQYEGNRYSKVDQINLKRRESDLNHLEEKLLHLVK